MNTSSRIVISAPRSAWGVRSVLYAIDLYKRWISPLFGNVCRFYPSCSTYTRQCVERFGVFEGLRFGGARICRCHPWNAGGVDLPPASHPLPVSKKEGM